jgi:hypothetical protein
MGDPMFEVTKYEPPEVFVTSRRTGETYRFLVRDNGGLSQEELSVDRDEARQAVITYLAWFSRARARILTALPGLGV